MSIEAQYGAAKIWRIYARTIGATPGLFEFTEKFHESDDKRFDAIFILGGHLNHDHNTPTQDVLNSFIYRGFSKKARAISRLFIRSISIGHSIPNWRNMAEPVLADYCAIESSVGTVDHGWEYSPVLASDGILGYLYYVSGYHFETLGDPTAYVFRNWVYHPFAPIQYEYNYLECVYPLAFYHRSVSFEEESKPARVYYKIEAGVRFAASKKANPKFSKGISIGGSI